MLGTTDNVFVVAPAHPLAAIADKLTNEQLCLHRAIVISDSARFCHPMQTNLMDEQPQIHVDDFHSKVALLRAGMGCGFLPRHIASPWLATGELVEKASSLFAKKMSLIWHGAMAETGWRIVGGEKRCLKTPTSRDCISDSARAWRKLPAASGYCQTVVLYLLCSTIVSRSAAVKPGAPLHRPRRG